MKEQEHGRVHEERYYEIAKERILGTASDGVQLTLF